MEKASATEYFYILTDHLRAAQNSVTFASTSIEVAKDGKFSFWKHRLSHELLKSSVMKTLKKMVSRNAARIQQVL